MYTSIGPVLIAVNPYKQLTMGGEGIYSAGVRDYYHRKVSGWVDGDLVHILLLSVVLLWCFLS